MSEWDQRQLCPDGGCTGVIGSDGICKVCGHAAPNWGDERMRGLVEPPAEEEDDEVEDQGPASVEATPETVEGWGGRKLCPDDSCIGVVGDDGTCKVCGRRAA